MRIYKLNKTVLSVKNNAGEFLNGLTSNDMDKPANAFLNIHGRIIATFAQVQVGEEEFYLAVEKPFVSDVLAHLERYAGISGVQITDTGYNAYFDLDNVCSVEEKDWAIPQKCGKILVSPRSLETTVSDEEFTLFRLKNHLPVQGPDYNHELLLNVSTTDLVSFTKGCYLGQEPVSKVYNRSKPSWILTVKFADECSDEEKGKMTSKAIDPESGRLSGFVFVKNE